ncbi:MAG: hypothetical protein NC033_02855 [Clostridiales bacterium]|nr:hypothetical protein [Clostridiales bacterium]
MSKCPYFKDRALAELYTVLLIVYENYRAGAIPKSDFESIKRTCLYDKDYLKETIRLDERRPLLKPLADPDKTALDVLNELAEAGAISVYEYNTQKERHYLY